ncbi:SRSF kinase 1 [Olea europaea subsp. europaea]|uniref:non-specific serine/threonine protein kinase n=1 Tax=Olea europaea subsp. europaea TaxID=158383 RepID=A0A8S0TUL9_OLEEU|nr:SRSF kinase 1 [Olea europaea subsp. europaea]
MINPAKDPTKSYAFFVLPFSKSKILSESGTSKDVKSSNGDLTKNQKKKIRKKAKRAAQKCVGKEASDSDEPDNEASSPVALGGRYSRELFNRYGGLRHIRRLKFWHLNKVLREKYEFSEQDANDMADFLVQILDFVPEKRPTAAQCLNHPWISAGPKRLTPSMSQLHSMGNDCAEKKREKDEREAMEDGVGNIAIDGAPKPVKYSQPTVNPPKQP